MVVNPYKQDESRRYWGAERDGEMSSISQAGIYLFILTRDVIFHLWP